MWQLFCVDEFIRQYGHDPYEPYDPAWFIEIRGKAQNWPFAYVPHWRRRLGRHFQAASASFEGFLLDVYLNGLPQLGAADCTWRRGSSFRSICAQRVGEDRFVWGCAELAFDVYGLRDR